MAEVACPFCGITSEPLVIELHIEESHTEPWNFHTQDAELAKRLAVDGEASGSGDHAMSDDEWTKCTRPGCGEYVLRSDIDEHLGVHAAIAAASDGGEGPSGTASSLNDRYNENRQPSIVSPQKLQKLKARSTESRPKPSSLTLLDYFSGYSSHGRSRPQRFQAPRAPGRLGKRELGPYAFEKSMPDYVRRQLLNDAVPYHVNKLGRDGKLFKEAVIDNETVGLIHVLADLSALDRATEATYFCDPSVKHICKLRCEGNFCGYWSIQMLLSYLHAHGALPETEQLPNVLHIQDTIEQAWENGICSYGRTETGGVRGTRKWIGTSEAVAYLRRIGVSVEALSFKDDDDASELAVVGLLDYVEAYFMSGVDTANTYLTSHVTQLAPIYFQRRGHSMTIVGLERKMDGSRSLLVFDSSFTTSDAVQRLLGRRKVSAAPETLLRAYRRSDQSLARWDEFEIVVPQVLPTKAI